MVGRPPSVSSAVKEFIESRPFLKECLSLGLVNFSAMTRYLQIELGKRGFEASLGAIKMALIRLREELKKEYTSLDSRIRTIIASSVMELQTDLVVISAYRNVVLHKMPHVMKIMGKARFFQLTQGTVTFTIIAAREVSRDVINLLGKENIMEYLDDQTAIVIISPEEITKVPGVIALISTVLASNNINITQIISCYRETILVCNREQASKAYSILENMIMTARRTAVSNVT